MAIISSGQITIIDLYDAPSLNVWIGTSLGSSQVYDGTAATYNPNYADDTGQQLTLHLTKAGSADSLIGKSQLTNVTWTKSEGATTKTIASKSTTDDTYIKPDGSENSVLVEKENLDRGHSAATYTVSGTWTDPNTDLPVDFSASITLELIQLAKAAVIIDARTPDGYFFKNNTPASLSINAFLYKDGAISNGSKLVKWFRQNSAVNTTGHAKYDADGGIGWEKITATTGTTGEKASVTFGGAVTSQTPTLTVYPDAVVNGQTYKIVITDNTGGSKGTKLEDYVTLMDYDDPIQVVIDSSGGDTFKNGLGTTDLTAVLYRNGVEIDPYNTGGNYNYTYTWTMYENNKLSTGFGTETGKRIQVSSGDVNGKAVFKVEVRDK